MSPQLECFINYQTTVLHFIPGVLSKMEIIVELLLVKLLF